DYLAGTDFIPLALTSDSELNAPVIFCGYGLTPSGDTLSRNDFAGTDVSGKWALILRGYPESNPSDAGYASLSSDRIKVLNAREKGAKGVLLVSGEKWDVADNLDKPSRNESTSGIPVFQVKRNVADAILATTSVTVNGLEERAAGPGSSASMVTASIVDARAQIIKKEAVTSNVVMMLRGASAPEEYVIIGAHYDHLGMGG